MNFNPFKVDTTSGLIRPARQVPSNHCDERDCSVSEFDSAISLLVIHNISLPPEQFGGPYIDQLFTGCLDPNEDSYFADIAHLQVSSHLLIRRDGELIQYVPFHKRAWHAGVSSFEGRDKCNEFSIGIELEGTDTIAYEAEQYSMLAYVTKAIMKAYPAINQQRIAGHSDIAPGRKSDPGEAFDWDRFFQLLK